MTTRANKANLSPKGTTHAPAKPAPNPADTNGNGVPDYIEKLGFWLENAYSLYTNPPFSMRDPVTAGRIPVSVTGTSAGSAGGGASAGGSLELQAARVASASAAAGPVFMPGE